MTIDRSLSEASWYYRPFMTRINILTKPYRNEYEHSHLHWLPRQQKRPRSAVARDSVASWTYTKRPSPKHRGYQFRQYFRKLMQQLPPTLKQSFQHVHAFYGDFHGGSILIRAAFHPLHDCPINLLLKPEKILKTLYLSS